MLKTNIIVLKIKKSIIPMLFLLFTFSLLIFSSSNLPAIKNSLILFANSVVPSLLPFFIATEMLLSTNIINQIGYILNPIMKLLFNISGQGGFAFIMGIISGCPIGAKISAEFRQNNICSKEECERLLSFTNNSGPLFIIGTVGITMFNNINIGILLFITHILASITVGIIFRFWKYNKTSYLTNTNLKSKNLKNVNLNNLGEIISKSITNSISTIFLIGGFIIIFSAVVSILNESGITSIIVTTFTPIFKLLNINISFINGLFTGLFEITNGINLIANLHVNAITVKLVFTSFLLGFGGISIMLQVLSIISKIDLSIKPYILGKILQGLIASFYTYIYLNFCHIF